MADEICADAQIIKLFPNPRESIIVETKTTTTTTTVTKRICIANDTNVDLTDIQSLLEIKDNPQTKTKTNQRTVPPNADDISKDVPKDRHTTNGTNSTKEVRGKKPNDSFLSSTKIDDLTEESNKIGKLLCEKDTFDQKSQVHSPLRIKNKSYFTPKDKNTDKKMAKVKKVTEKKKGKSSIRLKTISNKSNNSKDNMYIDGLINEYMTLEKIPRKQTKEKEKVEKKQEKEVEKKTECPSIEPKDLSAIFELSTEIESPLRTSVQNLSPIEFDGICKDDYDIGTINDQSEFLHADELPMEDIPKENRKSKRNISKLDNVSNTKINKNRRQIVKKQKEPKIDKTRNASFANASEQSTSKRCNEHYSPIKIYSPSSRGKIRKGTDNRLVLTKKMIEKKLHKHPGSSETMLQRLGHSNKMTIDANSRLIYYPNNINESEKEVASGVDFLSVLQKRCKPLLVKEVCTESE